jgi:hypothetical protein
VWLDGLRARPDDVQPSLADLGPEIGPLVEQAASVFADDAPRWNEDPDLDVADVSIPATTRWIGDRCPDLSVIGVGDADLSRAGTDVPGMGVVVPRSVRPG